MTGGTGQNVDDEKVDVSEGGDEVSWDILVERSRKERGGEGNKWRANAQDNTSWSWRRLPALISRLAEFLKYDVNNESTDCDRDSDLAVTILVPSIIYYEIFQLPNNVQSGSMATMSGLAPVHMMYLSVSVPNKLDSLFDIVCCRKR